MGTDFSLVAKDLEQVEEVIHRALSHPNPRLHRMALHLIQAGGKRFRPALGISVYRACGGKDIKRMIPISAAIEIIHTATLIHDDINDKALRRRGVASTHKLYGKAQAMVVGDYLFARAYALCGRYRRDIIEAAAGACAELAEGEILQMSTDFPRMTVERYLEAIRKKTGALMAVGSRCAAKLAGAPAARVAAMERYGMAVGTGFQVADDYLDVSGGKETGKPLGTDMRSGKATIVALHAFHAATSQERGILLKAHEPEFRLDGFTAKAIRIMEGYGSIEYARRLAAGYAQQAYAELGTLRRSPWREQLRALTALAVDRGS